MGETALRAGAGEPQIPLSGLRQGLLAAFRRHALHRTVPRAVFEKHFDGISRSCSECAERISGATVARWFQDYLRRLDAERTGAPCPRVLGIDEHFFTRRKGYATTLCDLGKHKVFDVVAGRRQKSFEDYLAKLPGKDRGKVICMDLSTTYRAIARKHFPKARIVADRFHIIRLIGHHFHGLLERT